MQKLEGKVAVITGGNSGIGLATAHLFHEHGAKVVIVGRNTDSLAEAKAAVGNGTLAIQGDVSSVADLDRVYEEVQNHHGRIDVLFANAGIAKYAPAENTSEDLFDQIMSVNVKGPFFTVTKAMPLLSQNASVIVTTSSVRSKAMPACSVYLASKSAVRSLVRVLAVELSERGIRVNALSPGVVMTPIHAKTGTPQEKMQEGADELLAQIPFKRFGESNEIAQAALFLASGDSSYIQGAELVVDGGLSQV